MNKSMKVFISKLFSFKLILGFVVAYMVKYKNQNGHHVRIVAYS